MFETKHKKWSNQNKCYCGGEVIFIKRFMRNACVQELVEILEEHGYKLTKKPVQKDYSTQYEAEEVRGGSQ